MRFLLLVGIAVIASVSYVSADNESKVNLVYIKSLFVNEEYFNASTFTVQIRPGNETHNLLLLAFDVVKELPADTKFVIDINLSNEGCVDREIVREISTLFCTDTVSEDDQYFSDSIIQLQKSATCGAVGHYQVDNFGYEKFYNLLTEDQLNNPCFILDQSLVSGSNLLYNETLHFLRNKDE